MMRPVSGLTVITYPYGYGAWDVEIRNGRPVFRSQVKKLAYRETDAYRDSGVFSEIGVPVTEEEIDYQRYKQYAPWEGITRNVSDCVCGAVQRGDVVLFAGGYCNFAPAIAGGIQRAAGTDRRIGVIWIDAHADCRIPGRSAAVPTRLVSVPLAVLSGIADVSLAGYREKVCGLKVPCEGGHIVAGDVRILDEETAHNLIAAGIVKLDASEFADEEAWRRRIQALAEETDILYLSVDADILKHSYVPSYSKDVPYGQELDTVARNVAIAVETGKVCAISFFCFNFDCYPEGAARTCESAVAIMRSALSRWKETPV